jgi:hypothetical protein
MIVRGVDADGIAETEAGHYMECPGCREWFDMRDPNQVAGHVHDEARLKSLKPGAES